MAPAAPAGDKPAITRSLATLEVEESAPPYVWATKKGKRVTFPDPGDMDWQKAEEFLVDLAGRGDSNSSREALVKWIGETGMAVLEEDHLTYRQFLALMKDVQDHYQAVFGTPGESPASAS